MQRNYLPSPPWHPRWYIHSLTNRRQIGRRRPLELLERFRKALLQQPVFDLHPNLRPGHREHQGRNGPPPWGCHHPNPQYKQHHRGVDRMPHYPIRPSLNQFMLRPDRRIDSQLSTQGARCAPRKRYGSGKQSRSRHQTPCKPLDSPRLAGHHDRDRDDLQHHPPSRALVSDCETLAAVLGQNKRCQPRRRSARHH
jgi:hypothetical protein